MNNIFISYYNKELKYLREVGTIFAQRYPKIASRLRLDKNATADPYVERLLEGMAYLTARTQLKIDAEYPYFVQRILEVIYPQFLSPTPAAAIVNFDVYNASNINILNKWQRGDRIDSLPIELNADTVSCGFSVTSDTFLTPLKIENCVYTNVLDFLPENMLTRHSGTYSALRIDFSVKSSGRCSDLTPDDLVLYLGSNQNISSQLLYLLMTSCSSVICHDFQDATKWHRILDEQPIHKGFEQDEALVFDLNRSISSLRLVQEYIQLPEKFLFIAQKGISQALKEVEQAEQFPYRARQIQEVIEIKGLKKRVIGYEKRKFSVTFVFNRYLPNLRNQVKVDSISINSVPIVNLFKKRSIRFPVNMENTEHHVVVEKVHNSNYEVHSIEKVKVFDRFNAQQLTLTPMYQSVDQNIFRDPNLTDAFFSMNRRQTVTPDTIKKQGGRTSYLGSEVFVSFMAESKSIFELDIKQLAVEAWCTNRDLPLILSRSPQSDFVIDRNLPISAVRIISELKKPTEAVNEDHTLWSLLNQLNLSYVSYLDAKNANSAVLLKQFLLSFPHANKESYIAEVNSIQSFSATPAERHVRRRGTKSIVRGVILTIVLDENAFTGVHPYLFASVLRHYFTRSVSINSFVEVVIETLQRGVIIEWKGLQGEREII